MKKPDSVMLGAHVWKLVYEPVPESIKEEYNIKDLTTGLYFDPTGIIYVDPQWCEQRQKITILHEMIHAIVVNHNIPLEGEPDVEALANALFNLIVQNPYLIAYILTPERRVGK